MGTLIFCLIWTAIISLCIAIDQYQRRRTAEWALEDERLNQETVNKQHNIYAIEQMLMAADNSIKE